MTGVVRMLQPDDERDRDTVPLEEWLAFLMERRAAVIMELRQIDRVLVRYGRLQQETLPRRQR